MIILTTEDLAIIRGKVNAYSMIAIGDNADARAVVAIAVDAERMHRIGYRPPLKPAERVAMYGDTGLREITERVNGEPLL